MATTVEIERVAEAIRIAYATSANKDLSSYYEIPEERKVKWREMAVQAICVVGEANATIFRDAWQYLEDKATIKDEL